MRLVGVMQYKPPPNVATVETAGPSLTGPSPATTASAAVTAVLPAQAPGASLLSKHDQEVGEHGIADALAALTSPSPSQAPNASLTVQISTLTSALASLLGLGGAGVSKSGASDSQELPQAGARLGLQDDSVGTTPLPLAPAPAPASSPPASPRAAGTSAAAAASSLVSAAVAAVAAVEKEQELSAKEQAALDDILAAPEGLGTGNTRPLPAQAGPAVLQAGPSMAGAVPSPSASASPGAAHGEHESLTAHLQPQQPHGSTEQQPWFPPLAGNIALTLALQRKRVARRLNLLVSQALPGMLPSAPQLPTYHAFGPQLFITTATVQPVGQSPVQPAGLPAASTQSPGEEEAAAAEEATSASPASPAATAPGLAAHRKVRRSLPPLASLRAGLMSSLPSASSMDAGQAADGQGLEAAAAASSLMPSGASLSGASLASQDQAVDLPQQPGQQQASSGGFFSHHRMMAYRDRVRLLVHTASAQAAARSKQEESRQAGVSAGRLHRLLAPLLGEALRMPALHLPQLRWFGHWPAKTAEAASEWPEVQVVSDIVPPLSVASVVARLPPPTSSSRTSPSRPPPAVSGVPVGKPEGVPAQPPPPGSPALSVGATAEPAPQQEARSSPPAQQPPSGPKWRPGRSWVLPSVPAAVSQRLSAVRSPPPLTSLLLTVEGHGLQYLTSVTCSLSMPGQAAPLPVKAEVVPLPASSGQALRQEEDDSKGVKAPWMPDHAWLKKVGPSWLQDGALL